MTTRTSASGSPCCGTIFEVDTRPTLQGAKDLQQALLSELEQVAASEYGDPNGEGHLCCYSQRGDWEAGRYRRWR